MEHDSPEYGFARLAVDKAKLCPVNGNANNPLPRVAIVLTRDGQLFAWSAKGVGGEFLDGDVMKKFEARPSDHAEQALLDVLPPDLTGVTAYVTLEPCTHRKGNKPCCARRLIDSKISDVYVGNCDPNPDVGGLAWGSFHAAGVSVRDFPPELRNEARRDNDAFFRKFSYSVREAGDASFDYESNGGVRSLGPAGMEFATRWTERGNGSIYALDYGNMVALAKNCSEFGEIDDPARWFEDNHYTKPVAEGQIVVFRNPFGYALIKILGVRMKTDSANAELHFRYELRYAESEPETGPAAQLA